MIIFTFLTALHWIAAGVLFFLACYCLKFSHQKIGIALAIFLFMTGAWAFLAALINQSVSLEEMIHLNRLKMVFPVLLPLSVFFLSVTIHGSFRFTRLKWILLSTIPLISLGMLAHPQYHLNLISKYRIFHLYGHDFLAFSNGPWFTVHILFSRIILIASLYIIYRSLSFTHRFYRKKNWMIFWSIAIPFVADTFAVMVVQELRYAQLVPTIMPLTGIFLIYAIFKYQALEVVPFARSLVVDEFNDPYILIDNQKRIIDCNLASKNWFNIGEQAIGKKIGEILSPEFWKEEGLINLGNENKTFFECKFKNIKNRQDEVIAQIIFYKEITDRVKNEENLKNLSKMKTQLIGVLAHDIVGHIKSVSLISDNLISNLETMSTDDIRSHAQMIHSCALSMNDFIHRLLTWAKSQAIQFQIEKKWLIIADHLNSVCKFLQPLALEKNVEIYSDIDSSLKIFVDHNMFEIVVRNIISNAIKFSPEGGKIYLSAKTIDGIISLKISDHGIGIEAEKIQLILESDRINESGLGLYICREFIKLHDGNLSISSQVGKGTEVSISFP